MARRLRRQGGDVEACVPLWTREEMLSKHDVEQLVISKNFKVERRLEYAENHKPLDVFLTCFVREEESE